MIQVTVFTPTYNRAYILDKLFESLKRQTNQNFEWLIIDDGSTDNTKELVEQMKREQTSFPIVYIKKENEGKHIAINMGAEKARGEWFFIVDSDDYLTDDAIEKILYNCQSIQNEKNFAGVVGLAANEERKVLIEFYGKKPKIERYLKKTKSERYIKDRPYIDATAIEYRYKYGIDGDRAEVISTELLKKYPFPQFGTEKFLTESYLWLRVAKDGYKYRWFNDIIYIAEYLDDGFSKHMVQHFCRSPKGGMANYNLQLSCDGLPLKEQIRTVYNYFAYGMIAGESVKSLFLKCNKKILAPVGFILAMIRKK